jgi:hypothetical protein
VISFGPYILPKGKPAQVSDIFSYTGFVLEFASEERSGTVSLYRIKDGMGALSDFFVQEKDVFCTIRLFGIPMSDPVLGKLHPLESLITALYLNHKPATSLEQFLTDMRERIPLRPGYKKRKPEFKGLLRKDLEEAGFEVIGFWQYGRVYTVSLGWVFPQDRNNPQSSLCLYASGFECKPGADRTLGKGKWMMPMDVIVGFLFSKMLKKMCHGNPTELLNDEGKEVALANFKWTQVSLLTHKELKQARIEFVRLHPDMHQNPRELAIAMIEAGLYSTVAQVYVIAKKIPGLIEAGRE